MVMIRIPPMRVGNRDSEVRSRTFWTWPVLLCGALVCLIGVVPGTSQEVPGTSQEVPGTSGPTLPGPRIADVELRVDAPLPPQAFDWTSLSVLRPGEPLSESAVRRTLSNIYATGRVEEAEVLTRSSAPGEVTVVLVVRLRTWVEAVDIVGQPVLKLRQLQRVIRQKPSSPLSDASLAASRDALVELYWSQGFRNPEIGVDVQAVAAKRARVVFDIVAGERALVGDVSFRGDLGGIDEEPLREVLRTRSGRPYDEDRLQQDVERLRNWWLKRDYLGTRIRGPEEVFDSERGVVDLTFDIDAGMPVEVEVLGTSRRRLAKQGQLGFLRDPSFDAALVEQSCPKLVTYYQRKGFYRADVQCRLEESPEQRRLVVEIDKGEPHEIRSVRFTGNEEISSQTLASLMRTGVRQRLRPGSGHMVREDLDEDEDNLRSYYLLQGFDQVEIGPTVIYLDGTAIEIEVPISEGPRRRVVELTWSGQQVFTNDEIERSLSLRSSGPFHPALLEESLNVLRTLYEDRGYRSASIVPRLDWSTDGLLVDVHLEIEEGTQQVLDRVLLRGLHRSRREPVLRSMGLERGEALSRRRLLEAERELYRLGMFSRVDVELAPTHELDGARDVVVEVEEGQRWRLGYGFSYHSDDGLGGLFRLVRSNIGGRGDRFQLDIRGNKAEGRTRFIYDQPSFLNTNIPITFILFQEEELRDTFSVLGVGTQVVLTKDWRSHRAGLIYEYRSVETEITGDFIDLTDLEREDREVEISSLTPNLFLDHRDDPLNPTSGWSTNLQLEYAFPFGDAEANFTKLFWQQTQYVPLGSLGGLAASLRLGAIENLSDDAPLDPLVPEDLPSARVPISERFFAGGRTSHRAFERDSLGIPGETLSADANGNLVELGGNGLMVLNLDYRFPISGDFGGTVFFDLGNVWADWRDFDPSELEAGAGLGFRYASPIGPIRLEIGWKLDSEFSGDEDPVFFLSFGNPF